MPTADAFNRLPTFVRWLLFLPGSIVAALVIFLIYQLLYYVDQFIPFLGGDWFEQVLLTPTAFLVSTIFFIGIGTAIAPSHRKAVGVFLALFPVALIAMNVYIRLNGFQDAAWPLWRMGLDFGAMGIGIVVGLVSVFKPEEAEA